MAKAVYIGAGLDISRWVNRLPEVETFVFIDSQPNSEYGIHMSSESGIGFSRPWFKTDIVDRMADLLMVAVPQQQGSNPNRLEFKSKTQRIVYYINTSYPEHLSLCDPHDLADFSHLIAVGHNPQGIELLQYTTTPIHFVGTSATVYAPTNEEELERPSLFEAMHRLTNRFITFTKFKDYTDTAVRALSWDEFVHL